MTKYQEIISYLQERYEYFTRLEFNRIASDYKMALDALNELTKQNFENSDNTKI